MKGLVTKNVKVNEEDKKIGLSIRAVKQDEYAAELASYRESVEKEQPSTTLGEALRAAQSQAQGSDE